MTRYATEQERLQAWADRRNKRAAERSPLFAAAGALDEVYTPCTAEDCRRELEVQSARWSDDEPFEAHATLCRTRYAELAGPEALAEADAAWEKWSGPRAAHYKADWWFGVLWKEIQKPGHAGVRCRICKEMRGELWICWCRLNAEVKARARRREAARGQQLQMQLVEASELRAARKGELG